jgi:hypothetical protein
MKLFARLRQHPLQVINYTELVFAFVAHVITIPFIGVLTGLICGCAVHYTIQIQADGEKPATRRRAFYGTLIFKIGQLWIHQTSFLFMFQVSGKTLPFDWGLDAWAWITTVFIFSIDVWALSVTSQEAAEKAEAAEIEESKKRMAESKESDRLARLEREKLAMQERIKLAEIEAETKTKVKLAAEETRRKEAEEARKAAEVAAEVERIKVETERKLAEDARKAEENARNLAEQQRKEAEAERKEAERLRKLEEDAKKAEEAERKRLEAEEKEKQREKWRQQKQNKKINYRQPETAQNVEA